MKLAVEQLIPNPDIGNSNMPTHVAFIMDGNGRWAKRKGMPRSFGHKAGIKTLRNILDSSIKMGIKYLTLYAFSEENWKRSMEEVSDLFNLLNFYLKKEIKELHSKNVRLTVIGDRSKLPKEVIQNIENSEKITKNNTQIHLILAISYGSRQEIISATRKIAEDITVGKIKATDINEGLIENYLYTPSIPNPDLIIRSGGEQRLSNFLLWQSAYSELFFTDTLWPDFTEKDFTDAILDFKQRERRYGTA